LSPVRPGRLLLLALACLTLIVGVVQAQMTARLILPAGEPHDAWAEAFSLAGIDVSDAGPPVEIVVYSGGWLLRVYADDDVREVPVEAATDAAGRERVAILAMSLLMPGRSVDVPAPEPTPAVSSTSSSSERDRERDRGVEVEPDREVEGDREVELDREVEGEVDREVEPDREVVAEVDREVEIDPEPARARPPERDREREPPTRRAERRTREPRSRPERPRRPPPEPPRAAPRLLAAPALAVHFDHLPTLALAAGGGIEFGSGLRVGLQFTGALPAVLGGFEEDGATRRVAGLGARLSISWNAQQRVAPLVGLALGLDVRRFGQDSATIAWVSVPNLEIFGGPSIRVSPTFALEPFVAARIDLRQIPLDVDGDQERNLLPIGVLVGLQVALGAEVPGTPDRATSSRWSENPEKN